jgi:predicted phage terminase large subunit-like protein
MLDLSQYSDAQLHEMVMLLERKRDYARMSEEEIKLDEEKHRLQASSAEFFREAWKVLEPGHPIEWSWHYEYIGEHLDAVFKSQIRRLIINVPPRTSKSLQITMCFPPWCWTLNPALRFVSASYSSDLSSDHSASRRRLLESQWYQQLWPMEFTRDTNRRDQYRNLSQGEMIATSVGATAMGRGGNILILDDGMSADEAKSKTKRDSTHDWYVKTFQRRLDDPANGAIILIEQRTHADDMTGWLLSNEPGQWTHIKVPLIQDKPQKYSFPSGKVVVREAGDTLQPNRFSPQVVVSRQVHKRTFATQDQQEPAPDSGIVFLREWWQYRGVPRAKYDQIITSWDFAVEGNADSDYNVGICLGKAGADIDVLDVFRARVPFTQQQQSLVNFAAKHPYATRHLVEKKANGPAIISSLQSKVAGLIAVEPQGSKLQRADAATPECESKNVYLIEGAPWVFDFVEELVIFPNGANDDQVDAFSQGVNWLRGHNYSYGLLGYQQRQDAATAAAKEAYMASANQLIKPDTPANAVRCPQCTSKATVRIGNQYRCNSCGKQWPVEGTEPDDKLKGTHVPPGLMRK